MINSGSILDVGKMSEVKVGDTLIFYDPYGQKEARVQRWKIYGESRKFWLCGNEDNCRKVVKNGLEPVLPGHGKVFVEQKWEEMCQLKSIKDSLLPKLQNSNDLKLWTAIAQLVEEFEND